MDFTLKPFVATERKLNLVDITIQESILEGMLNPVLVEIFSAVNTFLVYTDNEVTADQKTMKIDLYDTLVEDGTLDKFYADMPGSEYDLINRYLDMWAHDYKDYLNSAQSMIESVKKGVMEFVETSGPALEQMKEFDFSQLKELVPLAQAFGMKAPVI